VPTSRVEEFWALLRPMWFDGGRVLFVDEHTDELEQTYHGAGSGMIERALLDGSSFHIVKNVVNPDLLTTRLEQLGWRCRIHREGTDWERGEAQPQQ